jgi:hypothetical protein
VQALFREPQPGQSLQPELSREPPAEFLWALRFEHCQAAFLEDSTSEFAALQHFRPVSSPQPV